MNASSVAEVDLLINSTSVGMYPQEEASPLADASISRDIPGR